MTAPADRPAWRVSATTCEGEIEFLEPNELAARRRAAILVHQGFVPVLQPPQELAGLALAVDRPEAAQSDADVLSFCWREAARAQAAARTWEQMGRPENAAICRRVMRRMLQPATAVSPAAEMERIQRQQLLKAVRR